MTFCTESTEETDTGLRRIGLQPIIVHQQLLKLHFRLQFYRNFRLQVIYHRAINTAITAHRKECSSALM